MNDVGKNVHEELDVPAEQINSPEDGSSIETWRTVRGRFGRNCPAMRRIPTDAIRCAQL